MIIGGVKEYDIASYDLQSALCKRAPRIDWNVMIAMNAILFLEWEHVGITPDVLVVTAEVRMQGERAFVRNQVSINMLKSLRDESLFINNFVYDVAVKFGRILLLPIDSDVGDI